MRTMLCELTGKVMIGRDAWYGSYEIEVIGSRCVPGGHRIDARIITCIVPPSDRAILNKDAVVHRSPYPTDSIQNFAPDCIYAQARAKAV